MNTQTDKDEGNKEVVVGQQSDEVVTPNTDVVTEVTTRSEPVIDPEDEKRGGVKEIAQNTEALVSEKDKPKEDKPVAKPSFFVKKASRTQVKLDVLTNKEDGRIVSVSKAGLGIDFAIEFPFMVHTELLFEFSLPNYEDISTYRQRSAVYRREAQQMIVDKLQLRNFLLVWHLKDWNLTDDDGKKVELTFDPNGSMSEESLAVVYAMSPTLMDVVMTVFEKDILLS